MGRSKNPVNNFLSDRSDWFDPTRKTPAPQHQFNPMIYGAKPPSLL